MALKKYKPITNGRRNMTTLDFAEITKTTPEKSLLQPLPKRAGRNNQGKLTVRHHGGGHKRQYRVIDFKRNKDGITAKVDSIQYDPNRSANIALLVYADGEKRYIIAPKGLQVGQTVESGSEADIKVGNALPLQDIPVGTVIHNIELKPGKGGQVGNLQHELVNVGKAGRSRWKGVRPTVRGSVMNPNDHPHGGGEGRAPIGRPSPMSPWGKPTLGKKTRRGKKSSDKLIVRGRKRK